MIAAAGLMTLTSFLFLLKKIGEFRRMLRLLDLVKQLPLYSVKHLHHLPLSGKEVLVLCQGLLKSESPLRNLGTESGLPQLLYSVSQVSSRNLINFFNQKSFKSFEVAKNIFLEDVREVGFRAKISSIDYFKFMGNLQRLQEHSTRYSVLDVLFRLLLFLVKLLVQERLDSGLLKTSFTFMRRGIKEGNIFVILGTLAQNGRGEKVFTQIKYASQSKESIVKKVSQKLFAKSTALALSAALTLVAATVLVRLVLKWRRERRGREQAESGPVDQRLACVICRQSRRNAILKPCLHLAICTECLSALPQKKCPLCKRHFSSFVGVDFD